MIWKMSLASNFLIATNPALNSPLPETPFSRKRIALSQLEGEQFIGFVEEKFPGRNAAISAACQAAGFIPRLGPHVESLTALLALVAAGKGVALAPAEVSQLAHPQAVFVSL